MEATVVLASISVIIAGSVFVAVGVFAVAIIPIVGAVNVPVAQDYISRTDYSNSRARPPEIILEETINSPPSALPYLSLSLSLLVKWRPLSSSFP